MIFFDRLRTQRLSLQLQELSIGQAIDLCEIPHSRYEQGTTALLRAIAKNDASPKVGQVQDCSLWSIQERALAVAHYLAHTSNPGFPDFAIGKGKFSDYYVDGKDYTDSVLLGDVAGDKWYLHQMLGIHAESIERLMFSGQLESNRAGWWFGAMACQLRHDGEELPDYANMLEAHIDSRVLERIAKFRGYPERQFLELLSSFLTGLDRLTHFFMVDFSKDGPVFMPANKTEVPGLPPARFPFSDAIAEGTERLFGKP